MTITTRYRTGDFGEKVTKLPGYGVRTVVYSLDILDVIIGDELEIMGEFQGSNEMLLLSSLFGSMCLLTPNPLDTNIGTGPMGAVECVKANGYNLTRAQHHGVQSKHGMWKVTKSWPKAYVNLVSWTSNGYNRTLLVDADRGQLCVRKDRA